MNFESYITTHFKQWRRKTNSKPLVIREARQVGKTTLINDFAKKYKHFIFLNLEKAADRRLFREYDDVETIVEALFLSNNINAPKANEVKIIGDWMPVKEWTPVPEEMNKDDLGVWTYTTDNLPSDLYSYSFIVNSLPVKDPNNVYLIRDVA